MKKAIMIAGVAFLLPSSAYAFCTEPDAPEAPEIPASYDAPKPPYCMEKFSSSGRHDCDDWELESYQRKVNEYIDKLEDYARDAAEFSDESRRFAQDAERYADCEKQGLPEKDF